MTGQRKGVLGIQGQQTGKVKMWEETETEQEPRRAFLGKKPLSLHLLFVK